MHKQVEITLADWVFNPQRQLVGNSSGSLNGRFQPSVWKCMPTRIAKPVLMVGMFGGSLLQRGPLRKDKGCERRIEVERTGASAVRSAPSSPKPSSLPSTPRSFS
jgi:hypothetical protein